MDIHMLENVINKLTIKVKEIWNQNAKLTNITRHSKSWWDDNCSRELEKYRTLKSLEHWKSFHRTVKGIKRTFFNLKINEIANKKWGPWELMNWVNKWKLPALEAIKFNGWPYLKLNNFWQALHSTFNTAQHYIIDCDVLDELGLFSFLSWTRFTEEEFVSFLIKCNNYSTLGPDKLSWRYLKIILKDSTCLKNVISIANACMLSYFKISSTIIISKPNKILYDSPKVFRPIVLLNTLGKLIKKAISNRIQLHVVSNNFIHYSQLGSLKFKSMTDVGVALTHFIRTGWVKNLLTSTLAFDISQFFPSLNHYLLSLILRKAGLDSSIIQFFSSYLVNRKMKYVWNNFSSHFVDVNIGVGQGLALSPILSALYLASFLHILEKQLKSLNLQTSLLSFVDDGLLITQSKSFETSNTHFFCSYNIALNLLTKFGLQVKYSKTKVFHFSRVHGIFNPLPLDFSPLGSLILSSKFSWHYLSFIFNRKLSFHSHIDFYANKAI